LPETASPGPICTDDPEEGKGVSGASVVSYIASFLGLGVFGDDIQMAKQLRIY
jgi:hypothetical protein